MRCRLAYSPADATATHCLLHFSWILLKQESEWQWNPLGHMQVCTSLQTDNHASTPPLSFLQAGCPSCHLTNSVKALKAQTDWQRYSWIKCTSLLYVGRLWPTNSNTSICSGLVVQVVPTLLRSSCQEFDWHIVLRGSSGDCRASCLSCRAW